MENIVVKGLRHNRSISIDWASEEQSSFEYLFKKHASEVPIVRYANIAQVLPNKTIRDVVLHSRWMIEKENDTSDDTSEIGIFSYESIVGGISNVERLIERNAQVLDHIEANFSDLKFHEKIDLLCQSRHNIVAILNDLPITFHEGMPPFPFKINQELADSILPPAPLPKNN